MRLRYDDGCTERRRLGSGNGGTRCGCWREAGRPRPRPRRWNGTPTLLANGPRHSGRVVLRRWLLSSQEVPPRIEPGAAGRVEGGGAGIAVASWHRFVQLELEGGAPVGRGTLRVDAEPEWLPELPAPVGLCPEASQEAVGQGRPGTAGRLCEGVHCLDSGGPTNWGQDILR
ncbi:hypothetical protein GBAR_LOCUS26181 [Geodia barretti]|uniref:Uncharacterized protein n=1 Tax=Geodia barretti TaxID=519541 RepID=A0AA35X6P4_GEOBA|nr:hypothetical protein GBAR_LOCUS26181 [Geodia barretti]